MQTFILSWNIYLALFVFFAWEPAELTRMHEMGIIKDPFALKLNLITISIVANCFSVELLLFTYYKNPQNTTDYKHKVSVTIQFWQCVLKEKNKIMKRVQIKILAQYNGSLISRTSGINENKQTKHS